MSSTSTIEPDTVTAGGDTDLDDAFSRIVEQEDQLDESDDGNDDHERFSHYVSKEDIAKSAIKRVPVRALCGKKWVPRRNPKQFPVCPECKKAHEEMPKG